jgi:transcriptional regulator with XRE-family HTH domain
MKTFAEFIKDEENRVVVFNKIIQASRECGEWGRHGFFVKIANKTGLSAAYVGQVLQSKKPLTVQFLEKLAEYFEISVDWFRGGFSDNLEDARNAYKLLLSNSANITEREIVLKDINSLINHLDLDKLIKIKSNIIDTIIKINSEVDGSTKFKLGTHNSDINITYDVPKKSKKKSY